MDHAQYLEDRLRVAETALLGLAQILAQASPAIQAAVTKVMKTAAETGVAVDAEWEKSPHYRK